MDYELTLKYLGDDWYQATYFLIRDDGLANKDAKTKTFSVISRYNKALLGHIRWYVPWRQYIFSPMSGIILDKTCLRELSELVNYLTTVHREKNKESRMKKKYPNKKWD